MARSLEIENKILLACARSGLEESHAKRIRQLLENDISWEHLVKLAIHHKLFPLLYKHLSSACPDQIPIQIGERLKKLYRFNAIENLKKVGILNELVKLFGNHDIKILPIKGPLFTLQYLGDVSLRTIYDIDIVVSQQDFERSVRLLKAKGYDLHPKNIPENHFLRFSKLSHHGTMVDANNVYVEVHWRLFGHYGAKLLDYKAVSPFIEKCEIHGCQTDTLCPEMLLVYLAIHAQIHRWQRYDYLVCIAEVLNKTKAMDWHVVKELMVMLKVEKVVVLAIFMACDVLDTTVDKKIFEESKYYSSLDKITVKHIENWKLINKLVIERKRAGVPKWKVVYPLTLEFTGRPYDVLRRKWRQYCLPETSDWVKFPVPFSINATYYVLHPVNKLLQFFRR